MSISTGRCVYIDCTATRRTIPRRRFYNFPVKDHNRCQTWIVNTGNLKLFSLSKIQLQRRLVCEHHFRESAFLNATHHKLIHNALPLHYSNADVVVIENPRSTNRQFSNIKLELQLNKDKSVLKINRLRDFANRKVYGGKKRRKDETVTVNTEVDAGGPVHSYNAHLEHSYFQTDIDIVKEESPLINQIIKTEEVETLCEQQEVSASGGEARWSSTNLGEVTLKREEIDLGETVLEDLHFGSMGYQTSFSNLWSGSLHGSPGAVGASAGEETTKTTEDVDTGDVEAINTLDKIKMEPAEDEVFLNFQINNVFTCIQATDCPGFEDQEEETPREMLRDYWAEGCGWCGACRETLGEAPPDRHVCEGDVSGATTTHTYSGERPYECNVCGSTFRELSALGRHMLTHTNACDVCTSRFHHRPNHPLPFY